MSIKCSEIIKFIEELAPPRLAEDWDNVGLLVGSRQDEVKRIMVCLDVTSKVVDESISQKADLIVSHHPLIFKGLKKVIKDDPVGGTIYKLIRNEIGVYSAHTNLDFAKDGLNQYLAELLGLKQIKNLKTYKSDNLYKVVVYVPQESTDAVRNAMGNAGAGWIGNYSDCFYMTKGTGTFKPLEGANPYIGSQGSLEKVDEYRLETVVPQDRLGKVLEAMVGAHPYEEVAYDVFPMELKGTGYGMGLVGMLEEPKSLMDLITSVKERLSTKYVRLIGEIKRDVRRVAVFSGSFDDDWSGVINENADVLITGDIKHHAALDAAEMGLCVIDAGHFNTEKIIVPRLAQLISERFAGIEVICNTMEIDPIKIT